MVYSVSISERFLIISGIRTPHLLATSSIEVAELLVEK